MSKKYKVNFIACTYNQLSNQNKVKGNLIAIMDRSEAYYDLPSGAPGTPLQTEVIKELGEGVRSDLISTYEYKEMSVNLDGPRGNDINLQMIPVIDSEEQSPIDISSYIDRSNKVDISEYDGIILILSNQLFDPQEVKLTLINEDVIDEHIVRRKLAGVGSGSELPEPVEVLGSNKLHGDPEYFIVFNSATVDNGLYVWDPSGGDDNLGAYQLIAEIDSGKVTVDTQDDKLYLTGIKTDDPQGKVQLQVSPVYIHPTTHAIVGNLNGRASRATKADSATSATNATNAEKATKDDIDQEIKVTYIKNVEVDGRDIVTTKGDGTTQTQTVSEARYYQQLPYKCNLNDIKEPSLYYGCADNLITNKPEGVNSFGLDVYYTDKVELDYDGYPSVDHDFICQELHASGFPWVYVGWEGEAPSVINKIELTPTAMLDGELKLTFNASSTYDPPISTDSVDDETFNPTAGYSKFDMWDNILFEYVDSNVTKLITLRDALMNIEFTGEDAFYLSSNASTQSLSINIPGSLFTKLTKIHIRPKTKFPTVFNNSNYLTKSPPGASATYYSRTCKCCSNGYIVSNVDIDYPEQNVSSEPFNTTVITSTYPQFKQTNYKDNCYCVYTHISSGESDKFFLILDEFASGVGTNYYKIKINDNWIPKYSGGDSIRQYASSKKAIPFDYQYLTYNVNNVEVYSYPASDTRQLTLQGQCYIINEDSTLPNVGTPGEFSSSQDYIRKCIDGEWTDWEDAHGVSYEDIYIP